MSDDEWEWNDICTGDGRVFNRVRVACLHRRVVPVEVGGEMVAHLCLTCDEQLPGEWRA